MSIEIREYFLRLVRLGIGCEAAPSFEVLGQLSVEDWQALKGLANEHGLLGVMLDGLSKLPCELWPAKEFYLQGIGQLALLEQQYVVQAHAAEDIALLLHRHDIRTYVLKGAVVAECYPKPEHRLSVDMDCFLTAHTESTESTQVFDDVWERGNRVLEEQGFEVRRDFYKNSTVILPGLTVENHRYLTPFRCNRTLRRMEIWLQSQMKVSGLKSKDGSLDNGGKFEGSWLYRPPVMVSALFLIEHAFSHFLHEGLTWRMVLDWQMFCRRHRKELDWCEFAARVDEFGFRIFYDTYNAIGIEAFAENDNYVLPDGSKLFENPTKKHSNSTLTTDYKHYTPNSQLKDMMLADIWAPLDVHENVAGLRGKLVLAGNIWRARWKYQHFTDSTWLRALWGQAKGVLFENDPKI